MTTRIMFQRELFPALIVCILMLTTGQSSHAQIPLPDDNETPAPQPPKVKTTVTKSTPTAQPPKPVEKAKAPIEIMWLGTETVIITIGQQEIPMLAESSKTAMLVADEVFQLSVKTPNHTYHADEFLLIPTEGGGLRINLESKVDGKKAVFTYETPRQKEDRETLEKAWQASVSDAKSKGFGVVHNPATGRYWLDRNLGAIRVATSATDEAAYGDLYQWGRGPDGHQKRNSPTTRTPSSSNQPGHGSFIEPDKATNYNWRSIQDNNLWQGLNGVNNPCPSGFRIPTDTEWKEERLTWHSTNMEGAFKSPLKLTAAGRLAVFVYTGSSGMINIDTNPYGNYWSSTVSGAKAKCLHFSSSGGYMAGYNRADGASVRCIKD